MLHTGWDHPAWSFTYWMFSAVFSNEDGNENTVTLGCCAAQQISNWKRLSWKVPSALAINPFHFQKTTSKVQDRPPPPWQWIYLRGLLTEDPSTAGRILAASKFSSNEVTTLCSTHFSKARSSFPSLQRAVFSASHSASLCCNAKVKLLLNGRGRWFMRGFSKKKQ